MLDSALQDAIRERFQRIEERTREIQRLTGLHCPPGCGKCCNNPQVEASPLDWIPQAIEILKKGELDSVLERLESSDSRSICLYYISDSNYEGRGRCSVYERRPMVCRLFGYSAVRDKNGNRRASVCKVHKESQTHEANRFRVLAENSDLVPVFSEVYWEFSQTKPNWSEQMPINLALRKALEIVSLYPEKFYEAGPENNPDSTCIPEAS